MNKISCIICAYNEEPRIGAVLSALKDHPLLDEVVVVDDGSTDNTKKRVEEYPWVRLIFHPQNMGKSQAMATGILNSKNELLMFLDADLKNLTPEDVTALAMPVLQNKSEVSMTLRKNSLGIYKLIGLDFVSGERVIPKKYLVGFLGDIKKLPGYGIEVFINKILIRNNLRTTIVNWKSVSLANKISKIGFWKGIKGETKMVREVVKVASFLEIVSQNYHLLKLSKSRKN